MGFSFGDGGIGEKGTLISKWWFRDFKKVGLVVLIAFLFPYLECC